MVQRSWNLLLLEALCWYVTAGHVHCVMHSFTVSRAQGSNDFDFDSYFPKKKEEVTGILLNGLHSMTGILSRF